MGPHDHGSSRGVDGDSQRDTDWKSYFRSLINCNTEAVFSAGDPLPGVAEVALIPYLAIKRGF